MTGFPSNVNETKVLWGGDRYISAKKREDNTFQKEDNRRQREDNNRLRKTIIFKGRQQEDNRASPEMNVFLSRIVVVRQTGLWFCYSILRASGGLGFRIVGSPRIPIYSSEKPLKNEKARIS